MAQHHLDRLTATDASFLVQETDAAHMHIGAVSTFEGPPPPYEELLDHVRARLHLVPRYRQRLRIPPAGAGRPLWVDDPSFNIEYHVRQSALPTPGEDAQLLNLVGRVMSQQLDRDKPLWELWVVEGLQDGGFCLISKTHHALIDGVSGIDLATVLFDLTPVPAPVPHPDKPWVARKSPTASWLLAAGTAQLARRATRLSVEVGERLTRPRQTVSAVRDGVEGVGELLWAGLNPPPETPLNVEIGPHRRFVGLRAELSDLKAVKDAFGGTVNDVVLTVVAGGLRRWLQSRGIRTAGLELRALVPLSVRDGQANGALGNRIAAIRGPLPVYIEDPVSRLRAVAAAMDGLKESKQAVGAEVLSSMQGFAPPTVLAQASRLNFSSRGFNVAVTNVPGPQFPLYVRGRAMRQIVPISYLPEGHALAVAIMSYDGGVGFGFLADLDAVPDVQTIADGVESSLFDIVTMARRPGAGSTARAGRS